MTDKTLEILNWITAIVVIACATVALLGLPEAHSAEVKIPKLTCKMVRVLKNKRIGKRVIKLSTFKRVCKVSKGK